jgi:transcriptional regulator with XRE-family HTH domain
MEKTITDMLGEIKAATGWSEPRIATELNTSQPTVNRILRGQTECRASTYRAITDLHTRLREGEDLGSPLENAPRRRSTDPR